jgi:hypothetical protein
MWFLIYVRSICTLLLSIVYQSSASNNRCPCTSICTWDTISSWYIWRTDFVTHCHVIILLTKYHHHHHHIWRINYITLHKVLCLGIHQFYKGREHTGLVYTNNSLSASSMILKSLSAYFTFILHVADLPLFHGKSLHTAPTGTFVLHIQSPICIYIYMYIYVYV